MSGIIGGSGKGPKIAGFSVQTSVAGLPIAIVYGTARVTGNLIHMPRTPVKVDGSTGGGIVGWVEGLFTGGGGSSAMYQAPIAIALCEGPIAGIGNVWQNKDAPKAFVGNFDAQGWSLKSGTATQLAWSYLLGSFPAQAVPYQSTAYVVNQTASLPNDSLPEMAWEIQGFLRFNPGGGVVDASPADIVPDFLTSVQYGLGMNASVLGSLTVFQDYCAAGGLFCSPVFNAVSNARDLLSELLEVANTGAVWSDGLLKFVPYGDTDLTGNGHTFTANVTPVYDLTDDDFLPSGSGADPIVVTRKDPAACYNQVTVEYEDRSNGNDYNTQTYTAQDQLSVQANGPRPLPALRLHSIKSAVVAQLVAQVRLQREINIRNTYAFRLGWRFSLLEPMDLVTLTDPGLGLDRTIVRLVSIKESSDEQGLDCVAEEWPLGTAHAAAYQTGVNSGTGLNANVAPGATSTPLIFEGPFDLTQSALELWIAASGGANWGGCDVYVSSDNVTFTNVGRIASKATYGALTAGLPSGPTAPTPDTTHTLAIDVSPSGGALVSVPLSDRDAYLSLCYVGGEFLAYQTATLTGAGLYSLTSLQRGLYGSTIPASHAISSPFVRCDLSVLRLPFPQGTLGQTVYFKFPAFNVYGAALEDLSTVASVAHTIGAAPITGAGAPQVALSVDGSSDTGANVTISGQLGAGASGRLDWAYRTWDATGTPSAYSAWNTTDDLPQTLVVPYLTVNHQMVQARVRQTGDGQIVESAVLPLRVLGNQNKATDTPSAQGQTAEGETRGGRGGLPIPDGVINTTTQYSADGTTALLDPATRRVTGDLAFPGGLAMDTGEDYAGRAGAGLNTSGDVNRDVPLIRAVANVPAIDSGTGKLDPRQPMSGTPFPPLRHIEVNVAADGATVAFGASFDNPPSMVSAPQRVVGPSALNQESDVVATSVTVSTFQSRGKWITGGSTTAETEYFASTLGGTTNPSGIAINTNGGVAYSSLVDANATTTTYHIGYDVDFSGCDGDTHIFVGAYKWDGATYTLVGSANYFGGQVIVGEAISFSDALSSSYAVRIVTTYTFAVGSTTGIVTAKQVTFAKVTAGTEVPMTPNSGQTLLHFATEKV